MKPIVRILITIIRGVGVLGLLAIASLSGIFDMLELWAFYDGSEIEREKDRRSNK